MLIRESHSLKDKRQVVRSIKDRLRNHFNVSIAEVDAEEHRQVVVLGFAMVSNESGAIRSTFDEILKALRSHPIAEFVNSEVEIDRPCLEGDFR